jgi:hypothetical protein
MWFFWCLFFFIFWLNDTLYKNERIEYTRKQLTPNGLGGSSQQEAKLRE